MKHCLIAKITAVLHQVPLVVHLARKKFVAQFVVALINSRKVQFNAVAQHLNDAAKTASNETRIEDFFRETSLNYLALATLLLSFLPKKGKCRLCIDRTEWNFGRCEVNILLISIGCGDVQLPLYWELLDNRSGNSNAGNRMALVELCLAVVGKERIGVLIGDREFVGHKWFKSLKERGIHFVMRVPKHHLVTMQNGRSQAITMLSFPENQPVLFENVQVDGVWGNVWVKPLANGEYLFLFGTVTAAHMGQIYRKRWTIEACFQNLKRRGFDLASTHLTSAEKLKKLIGFCSLAYGLCLSMGIYLHRKVQVIKRKKHGYKKASFSRHGLNFWQQLCRPANKRSVEIAKQLDILERWIRRQLSYYQALKIVG